MCLTWEHAHVHQSAATNYSIAPHRYHLHTDIQTKAALDCSDVWSLKDSPAAQTSQFVKATIHDQKLGNTI